MTETTPSIKSISVFFKNPNIFLSVLKNILTIDLRIHDKNFKLPDDRLAFPIEDI